MRVEDFKAKPPSLDGAKQTSIYDRQFPTELTALAALSTWKLADLKAVNEEGDTRPRPSVLARTDGAFMLYRGKVHSFNGPPESGKTWLALLACADQMMRGESVIYIDYEDDEFVVNGRLLLLGVPAETIAALLLYVGNPGRMGEAESRYMLALAEHVRPTVVVLDGMTEAYAAEGLDPDKNIDAAKFLAKVRPFTDCGAAVVLIDHVTKQGSRGGSGKLYALGAQHKLAGLKGPVFDISAPVEPRPGGYGRVLIRVAKDNNGGVRRNTVGKNLFATAHFFSDEDVDPPKLGIVLSVPKGKEAKAADSADADTLVKVYEAIATEPGASRNKVRIAVGLSPGDATDACKTLIDTGYVKDEGTGKDGAPWKLHTVRPYDGGNDAE